MTAAARSPFQFGWVIRVLSKDPQGFQIELADLGNGKHMIVATDLAHPVAPDVYRQAGYGPFLLDGSPLEERIETLKNDLQRRR